MTAVEELKVVAGRLSENTSTSRPPTLEASGGLAEFRAVLFPKFKRSDGGEEFTWDEMEPTFCIQSFGFTFYICRLHVNNRQQDKPCRLQTRGFYIDVIWYTPLSRATYINILFIHLSS